MDHVGESEVWAEVASATVGGGRAREPRVRHVPIWREGRLAT